MLPRDRQLSLREPPPAFPEAGEWNLRAETSDGREKTGHVTGGEREMKTDEITHKKSASFYGKHFFYA